MASEWATKTAEEIGRKADELWAAAGEASQVAQDGRAGDELWEREVAAIIQKHADAEMKRLRELCREAATEIMHQPVKWCCRKFSRPEAGHTDECIVRRLQDAAFKE